MLGDAFKVMLGVRVWGGGEGWKVCMLGDACSMMHVE